MARPFDLSRRGLLRAGLAVGCSAAASPFLTPVAFARVASENRLVVILLRGAMDGIDVVQPWGDQALTALRPTLHAGEKGGAADLDGFFALHPGLKPLLPLWGAGELAFVHAVSTPYRDKRSHFDGQDFLENGGFSPQGTLLPGRDGWLNRTLRFLPGSDLRTAISVGQENLLLLDGAAPVSSWTPDARLPLSPQARDLLDRLYARDPIFAEAARTAYDIADSESEDGADTAKGAARLAAFAAKELNAEARIAAFSITGWDTHRGQAPALGRALDRLGQAVLALRDGLGPHWQRTAVVAITEFGRTARENGSKGTDHGTGGAMLLAGGALSGAKVWGEWPGLGPGALLNDRDLRPTADVRRPLGWLLRQLYGLAPGDIAGTVFPSLDLGAEMPLTA
jgi:uncharacterized protein (DUF1501 family)